MIAVGRLYSSQWIAFVIFCSVNPAVGMRVRHRRHRLQSSTPGKTLDMMRQDPRILQLYMQMALDKLVKERDTLCPSEEFSREELRPKCCDKAELKLHDGVEEVALSFELEYNSTLIAFNAVIEGDSLSYRVKEIQPSPCGSGLTPKDGSSRQPNQAVEKALALLENKLRRGCPAYSNSPANLIKQVHSSNVRIVDGIEVDVVLEIGAGNTTGAWHEITVVFESADMDNGDIAWPSLVFSSQVDRTTGNRIDAEADLCILMTQSTYSDWEDLPPTDSRDFSDPLEKGINESLLQISSSDEANTTMTSSHDFRATKCYHRSIVGNQGTCASCWAFAFLGALADRICLQNPSYMLVHGSRATLSVQQVLSCHHNPDPANRGHDGCREGNYHWALQAAQRTGIVHEKLYPYNVRCHVGAEGAVVQKFGVVACWQYRNLDDMDPAKPCPCVSRRPSRQPECKRNIVTEGTRFKSTGYTTLPEPGSFKPPQRPQQQVQSAGPGGVIQRWNGWLQQMALKQAGPQQMIQPAPLEKWNVYDVMTLMKEEIVKYGPLYVEVTVPLGFLEWGHTDDAKRSVYKKPASSRSGGGHAMVAVGFGVAAPEGPAYWVIRNSWGLDWGSNGHYYHIRGINDCGIESRAVAPRF